MTILVIADGQIAVDSAVSWDGQQIIKCKIQRYDGCEALGPVEYAVAGYMNPVLIYLPSILEAIGTKTAAYGRIEPKVPYSEDNGLVAHLALRIKGALWWIEIRVDSWTAADVTSYVKQFNPLVFGCGGTHFSAHYARLGDIVKAMDETCETAEGCEQPVVYF